MTRPLSDPPARSIACILDDHDDCGDAACTCECHLPDAGDDDD